MWYIVCGLILALVIRQVIFELVLTISQEVFECDNTVRDMLISVLAIIITVLLWPLILLVILIFILS